VVSAVAWTFYIATILASVQSATQTHSSLSITKSTISTCTVIRARNVRNLASISSVVGPAGAHASQIVAIPMAFAVVWTFHIATILASVHSATRTHSSFIITKSTISTCTVIRARNVKNFTVISSVVGPAGANTSQIVAIPMAFAFVWTFYIATIIASVRSITRAHPSFIIASSTIFTCTVIGARHIVTVW